MATHVLTSSPQTVTNVFARDLAPVLTIDSGDELTVESHDVLGHLEQFSGSNEGVPRLLGDEGGLIVVGPIGVRGAQPGMTLAVTLVDIRPADWGWTMSSWQHSDLERRLDVEREQINWLTWDIDNSAGLARSPQGLAVDLNPFLGVIGVSPAEEGPHPVVTPHAGGGNLDCRALVVGSTLYLPVMVPDALLYIGDGHGAQGDGEVSGTAIECAMTSKLRVELLDSAPLPTLHADSPSGRITFGLSTDLNTATEEALAAMLSWIQHLHDVDRSTALALASASVDMHVTQIASPVWGVHAVLPPSALRTG